MFTIRCCKCGKVFTLNSIKDLKNGKTETKQGIIWGMTSNRLVKGEIVKYNDVKHLLVCCDNCIDIWRLFHNGDKDWHEDFFKGWLKGKYNKPEPFIFR